MTEVTISVSLRELIAFIRIQAKRGGYSIRHDAGIATCPAELMMNLDAILDAAERGALGEVTRQEDGK